MRRPPAERRKTSVPHELTSSAETPRIAAMPDGDPHTTGPASLRQPRAHRTFTPAEAKKLTEELNAPDPLIAWTARDDALLLEGKGCEFFKQQAAQTALTDVQRKNRVASLVQLYEATGRPEKAAEWRGWTPRSAAAPVPAHRARPATPPPAAPATPAPATVPKP